MNGWEQKNSEYMFISYLSIISGNGQRIEIIKKKKNENVIENSQNETLKILDRITIANFFFFFLQTTFPLILWNIFLLFHVIYIIWRQWDPIETFSLVVIIGIQFSGVVFIYIYILENKWTLSGITMESTLIYNYLR